MPEIYKNEAEAAAARQWEAKMANAIFTTPASEMVEVDIAELTPKQRFRLAQLLLRDLRARLFGL